MTEDARTQRARYFERQRCRLVAQRGRRLFLREQEYESYQRQRPDRCVVVRMLRDQRIDMHHGGNRYLSEKYRYDEPRVYWAEWSARGYSYRQNRRQHVVEKRHKRRQRRALMRRSVNDTWR